MGEGRGVQTVESILSSRFASNLPFYPAGQFPIDFFHLGAEMKVGEIAGQVDGVAGVQAGASVPGDKSVLTFNQATFFSSGSMRNTGLTVASCTLDTHCPRLVGVGSRQQEVGAELDLERGPRRCHDSWGQCQPVIPTWLR